QAEIGIAEAGGGAGAGHVDRAEARLLDQARGDAVIGAGGDDHAVLAQQRAQFARLAHGVSSWSMPPDASGSARPGPSAGVLAVAWRATYRYRRPEGDDPMKLLSFRRPNGTASWGIAKDAGVIDLGDRAPGLRHALWATASLNDEAKRPVDFRLSDIGYLPPIPDA